MKKLLAMVLMTALLTTFLFSCAKENVELTGIGDGKYEGDNGVIYNYAPVGYEPTSQGEECGTLKGVLEEKLYAVGELDTKKWLTTEYTGATTTVYYSSDIDLPTVFELEPTLCFICEQDENIYSVYTLGEAGNNNVDREREVIVKIIEMLGDEGVENEIWPRASTTEVYDLKFYSEDWPAIYYNMEYSREASGNYIYDRVSKRCINIGDLLEGYFSDEAGM